MLIAVLVVVSVGFGIARFIVPVSGQVNKKDIYKDLAHIWVGFLVGYSLQDSYGWILVSGLTVLEVVAFFTRKKA